MGYYVKALSWKKSEPKWKIQFVSYKKEHCQNINNSKAKFPRKTWDISKDRWKALGFYKAMTLEEAKARSKQLNLIENLKKQEERLIKKQNSKNKTKDRYQMKIPDEFLVEFEKRFITRTYLSEDRRANSNRVRHRWSAAQKLIMAIDSEPSDWYYNMYDFYDYFYERQLSIRYINEILKFANLWGFFISKKI